MDNDIKIHFEKSQSLKDYEALNRKLSDTQRQLKELKIPELKSGYEAEIVEIKKRMSVLEKTVIPEMKRQQEYYESQIPMLEQIARQIEDTTEKIKKADRATAARLREELTKNQKVLDDAKKEMGSLLSSKKENATQKVRTTYSEWVKALSEEQKHQLEAQRSMQLQAAKARFAASQKPIQQAKQVQKVNSNKPIQRIKRNEGEENEYLDMLVYGKSVYGRNRPSFDEVKKALTEAQDEEKNQFLGFLYGIKDFVSDDSERGYHTVRRKTGYHAGSGKNQQMNKWAADMRGRLMTDKDLKLRSLPSYVSQQELEEIGEGSGRPWGTFKTDKKYEAMFGPWSEYGAGLSMPKKEQSRGVAQRLREETGKSVFEEAEEKQENLENLYGTPKDEEESYYTSAQMIGNRLARIVDLSQHIDTIFKGLSKQLKEAGFDISASPEELAMDYLAKKSPDTYDKYIRSKQISERISMLSPEEQFNALINELDVNRPEESDLLDALYDKTYGLNKNNSGLIQDVVEKVFENRMNRMTENPDYVAPEVVEQLAKQTYYFGKKSEDGQRPIITNVGSEYENFYPGFLHQIALDFPNRFTKKEEQKQTTEQDTKAIEDVSKEVVEEVVEQQVEQVQDQVQDAVIEGAQKAIEEVSSQSGSSGGGKKKKTKTKKKTTKKSSSTKTEEDAPYDLIKHVDSGDLQSDLLDEVRGIHDDTNALAKGKGLRDASQVMMQSLSIQKELEKKRIEEEQAQANIDPNKYWGYKEPEYTEDEDKKEDGISDIEKEDLELLKKYYTLQQKLVLDMIKLSSSEGSETQKAVVQKTIENVTEKIDDILGSIGTTDAVKNMFSEFKRNQRDAGGGEYREEQATAKAVDEQEAKALKQRQKQRKEYLDLSKQIGTLEGEEYELSLKSNVALTEKERNAIESLKTQKSIQRQNLLNRQQELLDLGSIDEATKEAADSARDLAFNMRKAKADVNMKGMSSLWDALSRDITKSVLALNNFNIAHKLVQKIPQDIRKIINITKQLDQSLTNIRIVTGESREQAQKYLKTYIDIADQLGVTSTEVANATVEWLRQGYTIQQSEKLVTASMQLSKLGMMSASQATSSLT